MEASYKRCRKLIYCLCCERLVDTPQRRKINGNLVCNSCGLKYKKHRNHIHKKMRIENFVN